ncbi:MAG: tRNA-dihydrouridine synthase family protein [Phycisphaeraceae bacterium]|nr:MAG: tRNA-dihydrouridine synthase family protein [Phycisphaeraceae bacterium]
MGCDGSNATPPSPAIAPALDQTPAGGEIDPRRAAEALVERLGGGGVDPRVSEIVPGFEAPFFQAGLAGYSDAAMRIIARRQGCPYCVTEALLDITLLGGGRGFVKADLGDLADNVPGGDEDAPLAGQLMGSEPATMAAAAVKMVEQGRRKAREYRELVESGHEGTEARRHEGEGTVSVARYSVPACLRASVPSPRRSFAAVDINLACPVKKIARKARGGHWLGEPEGAIRILEAVREAVPAEIPVTVKMRRSFDETEEMRENFYRIFDTAYDIGCAWVTVHGRTVRQKYVGPSRWDLLREITTRAHPGRVRERVVFGSGDIWAAGDVFRMIAYTGVQAVSVARGCIGNPWIFRQCRDLLAGHEPSGPTIAQQRAVLEQHFELALAVNERMVRGDDEARRHRAERFTGKTMRKFGIQFSKHHPEAESVRRRFIAVSTLEDWRAVLEEFYECNLHESSESAKPQTEDHRHDMP